MKRKRAGIVAIAVAFAATAGAARWLSYPPAPLRAAEATPLQINVNNLDFGTVWETSEFVFPIPVRNIGSSPVVIERWELSCGCSSISPPALNLAPGEEATLALRANLTSKVETEPARPAPVQLSFAAVVGGRRIATWAAKGQVRPVALSGPPAPLSLVEEQLPHSLAIPFDFAEPVQELSAVTNSPLLQINVRTSNNTSDRIWLVDCRLNESTPSGFYRFGLTVRGRLHTGVEFTKHLIQEVDIRPDLSPSPVEILAVGMKNGETREESVTIKSISGRPVIVLSTWAEGGRGVTPRVASRNSIGVAIKREPTGPSQSQVGVAVLAGLRIKKVSVGVTLAQ